MRATSSSPGVRQIVEWPMENRGKDQHMKNLKTRTL